jgi:glutaredoxin-related protein
MVFELDTMGEVRNGDVQQILKAITGTTAVPQVFINGEFEGGGD